MNEYIGLTIGPIYPTLKQARSTRELWGASFLFSCIFRQISTKLKGHVILPYVDDSKFNSVGLYPDRIILKKKNKSGNTLTIQEVHDTIIEVFNEISNDYVMNTSKMVTSSVLEQLQQCIQIQAYEQKIEDGENIVFELYNQLDNLELFNQIPSTEAFIPQYFEKINKSILYIEWAGWNKKKRFPSIFDISAFSLKQHNNFDEFNKNHFIDAESYRKSYDEKSKLSLESFIKNCSNTFGNEFKPYQKYFALVHADGDNMGKIISGIGINENKINNFSKALFDFGKDAYDIITKYGGLPIYIGGDDLLFFAPLANPTGNDSKTILDLINELDSNFTGKHLAEITKLQNDALFIPSFSYGVSVNFCKYPIKESMELSYNNLHKAKDNSIYKNKNSVVITLQKHSGQQIETGFEKNNLFYQNHLNKFITKNCFSVSKETDEYNSFRRKFREYHPFIKYAKQYGGSADSFIRKNFDYDFDKEGFWKDLLSVLEQVYSDSNQADKRIEMAYFALRFIHFLNSDNDD